MCSKHFLHVSVLKNSFSNIMFLFYVVEKTRVKLSGDGDSDYINANHVKVHVVCLSMLQFVNAITCWFELVPLIVSLLSLILVYVYFSFHLVMTYTTTLLHRYVFKQFVSLPSCSV